MIPPYVCIKKGVTHIKSTPLINYIQIFNSQNQITAQLMLLFRGCFNSISKSYKKILFIALNEVFFS